MISAIVQERKVLDGLGAFLFWLRSVLGLCSVGGCRNLVGLRRPAVMISFHTGIFQQVWGLISGGRGPVVLAME